MFRRVDRILLRVPNLESAVRYYRESFGMELLRQQTRLASLKYTESETELVLHTDPDLPEHAVYHLVEDVRELFARRAAAGLRFIDAPTRVAKGYRATLRDRFGNVFHIIDHSAADAKQKPTVEDGKTTTALFDDAPTEAVEDRELLVKLYTELGRTADDLPYTPHFEKLHATYAYTLSGPAPTHNEVWRQLLNLRKKKGGLPKLGPARSKPPAIAMKDRQKLKELLGDDLGRRDRLPYTPRFDALVRDFNQFFARPFSPHVVWRLVATLAK